ncbi:SDR family NAD(P)-dependent oxidoreductase [Limoniibacter endophyticus]|uniref:Short-chain dehydrogenase n=1 Tax=Limoniibacter endophyticus TaxID=1565040 RepID=A0A8J3GI72_9HYPH|nr:SDR family oxidoreductase [Limoniibacter endophyticus]GHC75278.1 short-chain dehydrogenase [Limoniibacter endophyticus]
MTIALITGASRGLGKSSALHLARAGIDIVLTYQTNAEKAQEVVDAIRAEGRKAAALQLDTGKVATFASFQRSFAELLQKEWGRSNFDILLNNAGHGVFRPFAETTEEEFDTLANVHLKGVFFLTQTLAPMIEDGGRILNVSSGLARFSLPGYAAYATMKGGVETLTRYLAKELGPRRIAVNVVAPGATETDFGDGAVRDIPDLNRHIASTVAMGRAGLPDDIGGAIAAFLAGETGWMTGQRIEVSGGQNL